MAVDPEGFVLGPRAKRAASLIAAALTVVVVGGLVYLHQSAPLAARFVGVPPPPELRSGYRAAYEFVDSRHGWAAVGGSGFPSQVTIFRTTDGAQTWRPLARMAAREPVQSMHFWDADHGILQDDHVYTTNDAGAHWTPISLPDNTQTFVFASPREGWAVDTGRVFATDDGGLTWRMRGLIPDWSSVYTQNGLRVLDFLAGGQGWAGGTSNLPMVHSSADGGATWNEHQLPVGRLTIPGGKPLFFETLVRVLPGGVVLAWTRDPFGQGYSFMSYDRGLTWRPTRLPWPDLNQATAYVSFVDARDWWASSHALLYRTSNAGGTWKSVATVTPPVLDNMDFGEIHMVGGRFGWVVASDRGGSALVVTSDGGASWTVANVPRPV